VTPEGRAKIADFGIARLDHGYLTVPGRMLGSPGYMSPEQLEGEKTDARSDLFSLGVVLYTMLTGHRPFQGNSTATVCFKVANRDPVPVSAWNLDFPPGLDELVARAMAKDPAERFQTGQEMARELQAFREAHASPPRPLAGILRIIGQEPAAPEAIFGQIQEIIVPRTADPVALPTVTSNILHSETDQAAVVAPVAKKISSAHPVFVSSRILLSVGAALLVVISIAVWSKQKHSLENALLSSATPTKSADPVHEIISLRPNGAENSTDNRKAEPAQFRDRGSQEVTSNATTGTRSGQRHLSIAAAPSIPQHINVGRDLSAVPSPEPITVQMVHLSDLNVSIEHSFQEGQASITVDNHPVYAERLSGQKKRHALVFSHTQGRLSGAITLLPGQHDIVVRVQSIKDRYDASERLTKRFSPGSTSELLVKCDKHKNKLQLSVR